MIIKNSSFIIGAVSPKQYPDTNFPEIALCGRSNVGKSSLINKVINRKNLARTSSQPGKTRQLNYYLVETDEQPFYFVDLPGYGFAKASHAERNKWGQFIEGYLIDRTLCRMVLQVIDIRHRPTQDDIAMYQWLKYHEKNVKVVATKADKISKGQYMKHIKEVKNALDMLPEEEPLLFSSETAHGLVDLKTLIFNTVLL